MRKCSLFFLILPILSQASTMRISTKSKDLSSVEKVYISPGLVSLIEFPNNIIEVRVGSPETLKVAISQVSPKELTVFLSTSAAAASNLIVRSDRKIYVFDIIPSRSNHQDYIKISGTINSPGFASSIKMTERLQISPNYERNPPVNRILKSESIKVSP